MQKTYHATGGLWKVSSAKKVMIDGEEKYIMHGENLEYYKTPKGALSSKAIYKDGKRNGLFVKYYTDGKLYYKINYTEGKMNGVKTSYHKNGKLMAEMPYKDGKLGIGTKEYTTDGKLLDPMTLKVWYKKNGNNYIVYAQVLNNGKVTKRAEFYEGILVDGKYYHDGLQKMEFKNGTASVTLYSKPTFVSVSAKARSARNNYSLINKVINF